MGLWHDFGGKGEDIKVYPSSELHVSDIFGADLSSDAPCSSILYGYSHLP